MLYRRKLILNLLHIFGRQLTSLEMQKHLFMVTRAQQKAAFDFVPHRKGGYSFLLHTDAQALLKAGLVTKDESGWQLCAEAEIPALKREDHALVLEQQKVYGDWAVNELLKKLYRDYPYFASRSELAPELMAPADLKKISRARPKPVERALFTSGYEGLSVDAFIERLVRNDIRHVCDVRRNAYSMKYGFSKSVLKSFLERAGISYSHHPQLGIDSASRKEVAQSQDWEGLFDGYEAHICAHQDELAPEIYELLNQHQRVVLICFEANSTDCHRGRLSKVLCKELYTEYPVVHL